VCYELCFHRFKDHPTLNDRYLLLHLLGRGGFSEVYKVSTKNWVQRGLFQFVEIFNIENCELISTDLNSKAFG
jgi:hypothetical protein